MIADRKVEVDLAAIDCHVDELFWRQAMATPDAVAAICDHEALSYRELAVRAVALAGELSQRGLGRGDFVGLHLDRSLDALVGMLAVMRAGAAYVPLDPEFPQDRLQYMVEDSGLRLVLAHSWLGAESTFVGVDIVEVDLLDPPADPGELTMTPSPAGAGSDIIYVLYTSGSTGRPKGVALEHRNVVNFLLSMKEVPGLASDDVLLAVTTLSFDISVLELLLPLVVGARLVIATREEANDRDQLLSLLEEHQVTVMQATPSLWRLLVDGGWMGAPRFKSLCGGEALPLDLANMLVTRCSEVWNMYGPTETAIWSTCYRLPAADAPILIGLPIANTRVYILDKLRRPVPTGVPGELYIAGAGVARGYLNRPELNEECFLPDPFAQLPGERMYRTGDMGRFLANGNLEFRGRVDVQIKVRGFRIEPGEIEAVLASHEAVGSAVVRVMEIKPGDDRLIAYLVARDDRRIDVASLREHLRTRLPHYMVPQHFVTLDSFPLLPNGKINRKALPAPDTVAEEPLVPAQAPRTDAERLVAEVWSKLLGADRIGVQDNFFDLGGHSLLVAAAIAEIRKRTGVRLAINRFLFESLEQLATSLPQSTRVEPVQEKGLLGRLFGRSTAT